MPLRLLVIDGYDSLGQQSLLSSKSSLAGVLYKNMLARYVPDASIDILNISLAAQPRLDLGSYDGVCWTGSNLQLSKPEKIVQRHIDTCRALFAAGPPQFGSCWAAQLAAVAAGGEVKASPKGREFGLAHKIMLTEEGKNHPMYAGKPLVFDGFTSHGDIVTQLPEGAVLLAGNSFSSVQSLAVTYESGEFWAVQYHPEYDCGDLASLARARQQALIGQGTFLNDDAAAAYCQTLETLNADPKRHDIAWQLGFDDDVLNAEIRTLEVKNWLGHFFKLPEMPHNV